jgi:hypothetical protein
VSKNECDLVIIWVSWLGSYDVRLRFHCGCFFFWL